MAESVYSREQVDSWQHKLEEIAQLPRTTFTKMQVVEELIDTIEKALEARSYEEVAEGLKAWGLDISAGSLRQYVTRYRRSHKSSAASTGRKRMTKAQKKGAPEAAAEVDFAQAEAAENGAVDSRAKKFVQMPEKL
jgi:hypothetical protein